MRRKRQRAVGRGEAAHLHRTESSQACLRSAGRRGHRRAFVTEHALRVQRHQVTDDILSLSGVTRIVVTHTLEQAALRRYDGILVLKDGRITESGSFDELMEQKGYFYALYTVSQ